ncbi:MAG: sodium:proton antiporter [Lachnospiraceae bacterium]|nr:sodium:proton antiporter [Lachnospiraceae bacterium]
MIFAVVLFPLIAGLAGYFVLAGKKGGEENYALFTACVVLTDLLLLVIYYLIHPLGVSDTQAIAGFAHFGLNLSSGGFKRIYAFICIFMFAVSTAFSLEYLRSEAHKSRYCLFTLITLTATVGVFFSADLYTLFIFFEIMSLSSYVWVATEENREALRAASTYMAVAVIGSLAMLMGLFMLYSMLGTLDIEMLRSAYLERSAVSDLSFDRNIHIAGICLLFGFGAKAGAFPLHIWLPKAHPVAPAPASALLSGMLTKAGVFGILITVCKLLYADISFGELIFAAGLITMITGAFTAVFSVNIKKILACSSVSQIGFILVGTGLYGMLGKHGDLAVSGAFMHMVNHSFLKLVLFLSAGAVYMNVHKLDLNSIRGFGRNKTVLKLCFLAGCLSIASIPSFSGYVSKTLIHEAMVEYTEMIHTGELNGGFFTVPSLRAAEVLFLLSGGLTLSYMLKIFIAVFVEKNSDEELQKKYDSMKDGYMTRLSQAVLIIPSVIFSLFGILPTFTFNKLAIVSAEFLGNEGINVSYYSPGNLKGALISIVIGLIIYFGIVRNILMAADDSKAGETDSKKSAGIKRLIAIDNDKTYLDVWPKWIDLEDMVYRPLLLKAIPAVFGFFCRILDSMVDAFVVFIRKTLLRDLELPHELSEGTRFTHFFGKIADVSVDILNKTAWKKNPRKNKDHAHAFALMRDALLENEFIIMRSMSFGLSLFCLGLMVTVLYILITANII